LACVLGGACHRLLDLDEPQCRTNDDCVRHGLDARARCVNDYCLGPGATGGEGWACLGRVELPAPKGDTVPFVLEVRDTATRAAIAGVRGRTCGRLDPTCAKGSGELTSNEQGVLAFTVLDDFDGFIELVGDGYVSTIYYPQLSFVRRGGGSGPYVTLSAPQTLEALATSNGGASLDPSLGTALLYVVDCEGRAAAGVRFTADPAGSATPYYLVNRVPSTRATVTDAAIAGGGFINLPPGNVSVTAVLEVTGETIATTSVNVRAGQLTAAVMEPLL
jgi:hypothetical protein